MKLLQRIGIIALAALFVVGLTWGALQMPAVQSWVGSNNEHGAPPAAMQQGQTTSETGASTDASLAGAALVTTATTDGTASTASTAGTTTSTSTGRPQRPDGGGGEHSGGNVMGLVEVGKNLGIVVVVSLVVGAAGWLVGKLKPKRRLATPRAGQCNQAD